MEFHIARFLREELLLDDQLFSYAGNVVFGNLAASRDMAAKLSGWREKRTSAQEQPAPVQPVNAGALFAMGLIDELNHALIARYRQQVDPSVLSEAVRWMTAQISGEQADALLLAFAERFPNTSVYRGKLTAKEWLKGASEELSNRETEFEELLLLWLANLNPAFKPFRELFDDEPLRAETRYGLVTEGFPEFFSSRPPLSPAVGSLLDALRAPMLASPDSITGQLEFIREHWGEYVGLDLRRVLLAIDTAREDELAIWMRFNPPGPDSHRHGAPGGGEGFLGDEYVGFDDFYEWVDGPEGRVRRRRYATDYQAPLNEYEAFSADQAWMPNVVMMAKSTYVWLEQLSKKYGRHIHRLDHVPDEELKLLADRGMTALWLIGLWERSAASRTIKHLRGQHDAVASAYSLKRYDIAEDLGGNTAYRDLRNRAARFGLRLASDMVPNHMGIDADWVVEHPDWFVAKPYSPFPSYSFNGPDLSTDSRVEIKIEDHYYDQSDAAVVFRLRHHADGSTRFMYHGNDGTTFAWNDTAQIDYSKALVREQVMQAILHVARMFPIIRFDAAMVLAKRHVQRLWFPLPGAGGSIPSRAEDALNQDEFDSLMPTEFWREVVDRVAIEVPGTLLLAEAFWMLEGYFVRTLGMHRVYNSAFMNMLRDEENAKYRSYLKKTIEFDPDIMKRYVNFMSNPDERTTIDQFGTGDKCFGVATLMATLPGLPMFGHGQIEGYTERYGMEFKAAKMEEWPNESLVARHQHEIAPLLKRRHIFAESQNFVLYDFWNDYGSVDENVFAYSNRAGDQSSVVLYNNRYESTRGTIHVSAASMDKGSGELRQRSLADGLGIGGGDNLILAYRDHTRGLEYLRRASDLQNHGLQTELRGYQYVVLLDWRELRPTTEQPWDRLCDGLNGGGVYSVDEALSSLRLRPLHESLRQALSAESIQAVAELASELAEASTLHAAEIRAQAAALTSSATMVSNGTKAPRPVSKQAVPNPVSPDQESPDQESPDQPSPTQAGLAQAMPARANEERRAAFLDRAAQFQAMARDMLDLKPAEVDAAPASEGTAASATQKTFAEQIQSALHLPAKERGFSASWPSVARYALPSAARGASIASAWAPLLAYLLIRQVSPAGGGQQVFDDGKLRQALGEIFSGLGIEGEAAWRSSAMVRVLLGVRAEGAGPRGADTLLRSAAFWADGDVRWLTSVNDSGGKTYVNKERFEELLTLMQVPALLEAGSSLEQIEHSVKSALDDLQEAGYEVNGFVWSGDDEAPEHDTEAETPSTKPLPSKTLPATPLPAAAGKTGKTRKA